MTKVDVFSGFLGAGKTTLIKKLIKEAYAGEKIVLIENEFGKIGIDGGFLREAGIQINELNSGCICCSLVGDFGKALKKVVDEYHPDRILIEPSGVGKLSDVVRAIEKADVDGLAIAGSVTVVDAAKCKMYLKNFGEFFCDQVEHAGTIILSHTKNLPEEKIKAAVSLLREHNPDAVIVTTDWELLDGKKIFEAMTQENSLARTLESLEKETEHHHHHHHDGDECDDPDCACHHHHDDDDDDDHDEHDEHEHHHHDEDEHHHHHGEGECDDPDCACHHHHDDDDDDEHEHHHHHADDVFTSFGVETAKKFTAEELHDALEAFAESNEYGMVLRAKGIVEGKDGQWIHFDYVPGEPDIRTGAADITGRLCVIGSGLDKKKIAALFGIA